MTPTPDHTQAAITMRMREALETHYSDPLNDSPETWLRTRAALALPVSAAEAQVAEWKRKAEALDWLQKHASQIYRRDGSTEDEWWIFHFNDWWSKTEGATIEECVRKAKDPA